MPVTFGKGRQGGRQAPRRGLRRLSGQAGAELFEPLPAGGPAPVHTHTGKVGSGPIGQEQEESRKAWRRKRYWLHDMLRNFTLHRRLKHCCRSRIEGRGEVRVFLGPDGVAHYGDLMRCGLGWVCPVCAVKIAAERAAEIERGGRAHLTAGGGLCWQTFTLPHNAPDRLILTRKVAADAFKAILQGRGFRALRERLAMVGFIRKLEVTHGRNGWHPHLHVAFFTQRPLSEQELEELRAVNFEAWRLAILAAGLREPLPEHSPLTRLDADAAAWAEYLAKMCAAEIARSDRKSARAVGSRTPWEILEDACEHIRQTGEVSGEVDRGDQYPEETSPADVALWREYETAMHGARCLTWSRGLKAGLKVEERTDEEIVAEQEGGEVLATLTLDQWRTVKRGHGRAGALLETAEVQGARGIVRQLNLWHDEDEGDRTLQACLDRPAG